MMRWKRFPVKRMFLWIAAVLLYVFLEAGLFSTLAAEMISEESFRKDVLPDGQMLFPQATAVMPVSGSQMFLSQNCDDMVLGFSIPGLGYSYRLLGLWNDRGRTIKKIENTGMDDDTFLKRNGKGYLKGSYYGDGFTYMEAGEEIAMTEPCGYDGYRWFLRENESSTEVGGSAVFFPERRYGKHHYYCLAAVNSETDEGDIMTEEITLGEKYELDYIRFPETKGLRVRLMD